MVVTCNQKDPLVSIEVNGKTYECLIDSGSSYSTLVETPPDVKPTKKQMEVVGIEGNVETRPFLERSHVTLEGDFGVDHTFLYTPKCPGNLLGRDLLCKFRAQLNFSPEKIEMLILVQQMFLLGEAIGRPMTVTGIPKKLENNVDPQVWDVDHPKRVIPLISIKIMIKRGVNLPKIRQWPLSEPAIKGLQLLIEKYSKNRLIELCVSNCNTPIMAVPKPRMNQEDPISYRFIHNLKAVNAIIEDMPAIVANPYMILNGVGPEAAWFTVIYLKDAFFSVPLNEEVQNIFAFAWRDSETRRV